MYARLHCAHPIFSRAPSRPFTRAFVEGDGRRPSRADVPLPQGVWWLKHAHVKEEAAYGDSFVIHRPPDTELVISPQKAAVQVWHPSTPLMHGCAYPLLPPKFDSDVVEVEYVSLETESSALVLAGVGPVLEAAEQSRNPRRTQKIKFTCNRCRTRTEKFVNPIAWTRGVVFCRCDGCDVVHLIRDERGMFSFMKGRPRPSRSMEAEKPWEGLERRIDGDDQERSRF